MDVSGRFPRSVQQHGAGAVSRPDRNVTRACSGTRANYPRAGASERPTRGAADYHSRCRFRLSGEEGFAGRKDTGIAGGQA